MSSSKIYSLLLWSTRLNPIIRRKHCIFLCHIIREFLLTELNFILIVSKSPSLQKYCDFGMLYVNVLTCYNITLSITASVLIGSMSSTNHSNSEHKTFVLIIQVLSKL
jgi:hypothetical protein